MNCPEVQELFSDYLDDRLAPSKASLLKEHLGSCAACRQELADLRQTIELIGSVEEIKTAPDFLAQVNRKIDSGSGMNRFWRLIFTPAKIKIPIEAGALAVVAVLAVYLYRSSELSQNSAFFTEKSPEMWGETPRRAELDPGRQAEDSRLRLAYK
ncbi:MAG: anti-sigma factor family protein, partial [Candidatus Binatia bacterium]